LPGVLTAAAGINIASAGLIVALYQAVFFQHDRKESAPTSAVISGRDVFYVLFRNSAPPGQQLDAESIGRNTNTKFDRFGGIERLKACAASLTN